MLQRKTPLKSNTRLKSGTPLKRKTPLKSAAPSWGAAPSGERRFGESARSGTSDQPDNGLKAFPRKPLQRKAPDRKPYPGPGTQKRAKESIPDQPGNKWPTPGKPAAGSTPLPRTKPQAKKPKAPKKPKELRPGEVGEKKTRIIIAERSSGVCEICGKAPATDAAHRLPRSQGGLWSPSNLIAACRPCHAGNHANPAAAVREGWHLSMGASPLTEPVLLCLEGRFRRVLLHDDGTLSESA